MGALSPVGRVGEYSNYGDDYMDSHDAECMCAKRVLVQFTKTPPHLFLLLAFTQAKLYFIVCRHLLLLLDSSYKREINMLEPKK